MLYCEVWFGGGEGGEEDYRPTRSKLSLSIEGVCSGFWCWGRKWSARYLIRCNLYSRNFCWHHCHERYIAHGGVLFLAPVVFISVIISPQKLIQKSGGQITIILA